MVKQRIVKSGYTDFFVPSIGSRLKLLFNFKHGYPLDYPRQFWIEITNKCNLRCVMCPVSIGLKRKTMMMDMDTFVRIIDQIYVVRPHIMLHVAGEPLLNKNLFTMIEYATNRGCCVGMLTNAILLTKDMSLRILTSSLNFIVFSFDGCTPEVYEKVRVGAKFDKVKSNIETFLELRHERKVENRRLTTAIMMVVMKETEKDIHAFIEYWRTKELNEIHIRKVSEWIPLLKNYQNERRNYGHRPCRDIFRKCAILVDGTVVPCCIDIRGMIPLGNILKQPFSEIWNGDKYNSLRKQHVSNTIPENCLCHKCIFRSCWSTREEIEQWILKQIFWRKDTI